LRKLVSITDREWDTVLEQLRTEYNLSLLNPYRRNATKKGRKPIALGGKPNQPGQEPAGRPNGREIQMKLFPPSQLSLRLLHRPQMRTLKRPTGVSSPTMSI